VAFLVTVSWLFLRSPRRPAPEKATARAGVGPGGNG
jgi:hypothetical protein